MPAGAPEGNVNAEKWTLEKATDLFNLALEKVREKKDEAYVYDFIGELAREVSTYKEVFTHLKDRFKELKPLHRQLVSELEANCYHNTKKGNIKEATGIVNLKSNHHWTDRNHEVVDAKQVLEVVVKDEEPPQWLKDQYKDDN